ncbi:MAG: Ig-like domain-containing protein, partial [Anaerolineales bacterium]|nr:Ig-like domain-containing protein [Anaerolineales bacterium]
DLDTDTIYQLVFDESAIVDLNDNKYNQSGDYQFTTIDTIAPTATSYSPVDNATEIAVASDITVTFSEAIKRGTGDITLKTSDGTVVATYDAAIGSNLSVSDKTLTINPTDDLDTDTIYELEFDEGAIVDINDNKHKQSGDYQFTTIDTIKPTLLSINEANLFDEGTKKDIVLTFSEAIKAGTGTVVFKNTNTGLTAEYKTASAPNISITGSTLTITSSSLANLRVTGDIYTVEIDADAVTDIPGNKYEGLTVVYGRRGDDTFNGEGGNSFISGGAGTDKVEYPWDKLDYLLSKEPDTGRIYVANKLGEELGFVLDDTELLSFRDVDVDTETIGYIGKVSSIDALANTPVFRFYKTTNDAFFYTQDSIEKDNILNMSSVDRNNNDEWSYAFQGSTFNAASTGGSNVTLVHRFYNANTGHHLWSMDPNEIANIKSNLPSYTYEGPSFYVYSSDPDPSDPNIGDLVYRYYNSTTGRHFWTADAEERTLITLTGVWEEEGPAFWGE